MPDGVTLTHDITSFYKKSRPSQDTSWYLCAGIGARIKPSLSLQGFAELEGRVPGLPSCANSGIGHFFPFFFYSCHGRGPVL